MKAIVFDVDGTLTDGKIYMGNNGELFKTFDIKDGCGIHDLMPKSKLIPVIITARQSEIVINRCKELGIEYCYQGCRNKVDKLHEFAKMQGIEADEFGVYQDIAYMGDDIIDLPIMKYCGIKGCPCDAVEQVKEFADFISSKAGGNGAAREFIEWIIEKHMRK